MKLETYLEKYNALVNQEVEQHRERYERLEDDSYARSKLKHPDVVELKAERAKLQERYNRELEREKANADIADGKAREVWAETMKINQKPNDRLINLYEKFVDAIDTIAEKFD